MQTFWKDITEFIFIEDEPSPVDCLIVPGAPWIELIAHAATLYHQGITKKIIVCGKFGIKAGKVNINRLPEEYRKDYRTESEMMKSILVEYFSVPEQCIIEESESTNTYENALYGMRMIEEYDFDTIGICCQAFHARRAKMTFESIAPDYLYFAFPVRTQGIDKKTWHKSDYGKKRVLGELERCGKYFPMGQVIFKN